MTISTDPIFNQSNDKAIGLNSLLRFNLLTSMLFCCFLLIGGPSLADSEGDKKQKLRALLQQITQLQKTIDVQQNTKSKNFKQLKSIERSIGNISRQIKTTANNIKQIKARLPRLKNSRNKHQKALALESEYLAEQIYAAFTVGKQEGLKLLFSQQNPDNFQQSLIYYQYFSDARADLINDVQNDIDQLLATEKKISLAKLQLEKNRKSLKSQHRKLKKDRSKRKSVISSLDRQLKDHGGQLASLRQDAQQLQNLLDSIEEIFIENPEPDIMHKKFAQLRGHLAWPVDGKIKKLFGKSKNASDLRWQGVMIEAPTGRHIHAVSHGRVAFADWLRGLGNLIIIDHGNSYLSLYGHNESIFKLAGEWVEPGDIIGSIGNSGGRLKPGLYFEIRKKGKPQNPSRWCKAGNNFASL